MKREGDLPVNRQLDGLVKAGERQHSLDQHPSITRCPLAEPPPQPVRKRPLRLLMWHIFELGGGFYRPHERPDYAINAYADVITHLDVDVCVILGITDTIGRVPVQKGDGTHSCLAMEAGPPDTGPAEMKRILQRLKQTDVPGGWECQFLKNQDRYVYHFGATTCFLHRTSNGIQFQKLDVIDSPKTDEWGTTGKLLCATFQIPEHGTGVFRVAAPFGLAPAKRPQRQAPEPAPEDDVHATASLAPPFALAVSSAANLIDPKIHFGQFRAGIEAQFRIPDQGSMLNDDFWKRIVESEEGLLGNFIAVDPADVRLQDANMHWEAMEPGDHAETMDEVMGRLADTFLISRGPVIAEMRVVDLLAASIPSAKLPQLRRRSPPFVPDPAFPIEDSILVPQRRIYRREEIGGPLPHQDAANELAECCYFTLALSRHWPVITQLQLEP